MSEAEAFSEALRAPFPWFGGKRRPAGAVWQRFGNVASYNEPFAGSLAVLLGRPTPPRVETVNDLDAMISNFWRSLRWDPWGVAMYADWPVNEADLHARHRWLVKQLPKITERLKIDPDFYDVKVAGYWVYGQCLWIGSGWCQSPNIRSYGQTELRSTSAGVNKQFDRNGLGTVHQRRRPHLTKDQGLRVQDRLSTENPSEQEKRWRTDGLSGVYAQRHANGARSELIAEWSVRPDLHAASGQGINARRWQGGGQGGGSGVHAPRLTQQLPQLSGDGSGASRGYLRESKKLPALSQGGNDHGGNGRGYMTGTIRSEGVFEYLHALGQRLRRVRVCCGDWKRVLTPSVTTYIGVTGVFLDPPYSHDQRERCYAEDHNISAEVAEWARAHGDDPKLRIALCGYEGEHEMPASWECIGWKAHGGYSRSARGKANRRRERIWFSPHCLKPGLFSTMG